MMAPIVDDDRIWYPKTGEMLRCIRYLELISFTFRKGDQIIVLVGTHIIKRAEFSFSTTLLVLGRCVFELDWTQNSGIDCAGFGSWFERVHV